MIFYVITTTTTTTTSVRSKYLLERSENSTRGGWGADERLSFNLHLITLIWFLNLNSNSQVCSSQPSCQSQLPVLSLTSYSCSGLFSCPLLLPMTADTVRRSSSIQHSNPRSFYHGLPCCLVSVLQRWTPPTGLWFKWTLIYKSFSSWLLQGLAGRKDSHVWHHLLEECAAARPH